MKVEEKRKKIVLGLVIYNVAIVLLSCGVMLIPSNFWWVMIPLAIVYFPIALVGINLVVLQRWW